MNNLTTYNNQSVFDIALQAYGSIEGVFELLKANAGLELDSHIAPGTVLQVTGEPVNKDVVDYYKKNNIKPATGNLDGLPDYSEEDDIMRERIYNYDLANGDNTFDGIRLYNLNNDGILSVQINYSGINSNDVQLIIESSLDGVNYTQIEGAAVTIDNTLSAFTFNFIGLKTAYMRLKVLKGISTAGTIDKLIILM